MEKLKEDIWKSKNKRDDKEEIEKRRREGEDKNVFEGVKRGKRGNANRERK